MAKDIVRASQFAESLCRPIPSQIPSCQEKIALVPFEWRFLDLVNVESLKPTYSSQGKMVLAPFETSRPELFDFANLPVELLEAIANYVARSSHALITTAVVI